nr:molybdate transporter 1 [Ipomoea batatas]
MQSTPPQLTARSPLEAGGGIRRPTAAALVRKVSGNLVFRSKWAELNGAMGDLGTYIPIVLALTLAKNLDLGTTLIFTGVYNFVTGAVYGVPMPVQPMKSIAAAAISSPSFDIPEVMAAGICTGGILFLLGVTGLMQLVYKLIPLSVVRGIQLAQGLSFAMTAVKYVRNEQNFSKSKSAGERPWLGLDAVIIFLLGLILAIIRDPQRGFGELYSEDFGAVSGWGFGGFAVVCWD